MDLPFTREQFYTVFIAYNRTVWPMQALLLALALFALYLVLRPRPWSGRAVSAILAGLWAWMAIAYHFAFFSRINPAAYAFAGLAMVSALVFVWQGMIRNRLRFAANGNARVYAGWTLIIYALAIYPAWSWLAGHRYPAMPTFGLPCPTAIFTLGLLAMSVAPYPRSPLIVPVLWCFVGGQAAFLLGVPQDLGLVVAGAVGLRLLARRQSGRAPAMT